MLDVLSFLVQDQKLAPTQNYGAYDLVEPIDPVTGYGKIWRLKTQAGDTWDIQLYNEDFVFDSATEVVYGDPRQFKVHHTEWGPGIPRCPRYITTGLPSPPLHSLSTAIEQYKNCQVVNRFSLGYVCNTLIGPYPIDHGGDVGLKDTFVIHYNWNGTAGVYTDQETYWYVTGVGLVRWTHAKLDTKSGMYVVDQTSVHNKISKGVPPKTNFPCPVKLGT